MQLMAQERTATQSRPEGRAPYATPQERTHFVLEVCRAHVVTIYSWVCTNEGRGCA